MQMPGFFAVWAAYLAAVWFLTYLARGRGRGYAQRPRRAGLVPLGYDAARVFESSRLRRAAVLRSSRLRRAAGRRGLGRDLG